MFEVAQRSARHTVSNIDIELWAREQRRRWFVRTLGAPLRRLAQSAVQVGLRAVMRLMAVAPSRQL